MIATCFLAALLTAYNPSGAWEKAKELAWVQAGEYTRPPRHVTLVDEIRYYNDFFYGARRYCGETLRLISVRHGVARAEWEVSVYAPADQPALRYLILVHEMLHVLHDQLRAQRGPEWSGWGVETETYVRSIVPMSCPDGGRAEGMCQWSSP